MKSCKTLFFLLLTAMGATAQESSTLSKVNLFMGTADDYGQMAPGATVPFGMIQVCPDSNPRQHPGYDYEKPLISGISLNRLSGVGGNGCGGNVALIPGKADQEIRIEKQSEQATPGYYAATLSNGVKVRLTATSHMAVEQFTFPQGEETKVTVAPAASFERVHTCDFRLLGNQSARGYVESRNTCGRGRYHLFYRLFTSHPFTAETLADGRVTLHLQTGGERTAEVRIVVSSGVEELLTNLNPKQVWETPFDRLRQQAADAWSDALGHIKAKGTPDEQTIFYTSLYRTFHSPFQVTDDLFPQYLGTDGRVHKPRGFQYYSSWSLWDTYRTKFPLILLMQPRRGHDIMCSLAQLYITGKQDWSTDFECVPTVRSEHAIATLLDALRKHIVTPDELRPSYPGMVAEAMRLPLAKPDQCLETAGDFWALGQLAAELGYAKDAARWQERGEQLFDSIWPKEFMHIDETYTKMRGNGLYQGTRWQYRWGTPMFLSRMETLCGKPTLAAQLNEFFDKQLYNQGNEPDIHVPFLFGRLGQPLKAGPIVAELALDSTVHRYGGNDAYPTPFVGHAFKNATRGYCPEMDEDDGTMSAWFVFAAMGLYPLIVGEPTYEVFSPLLDEVSFPTDEAGTHRVTIRTEGRTSRKQIPKRATWNGKSLTEWRINHNTLVQGGELVFWY